MSAGKKKRPVGRPTDYRDEMPAQVVALGKEGKSRAQIAANLDIAWATLQRWEEDHPEFKAAMTRARELAMAWWEDQGQVGINAKTFNANAWSLQVRNRFPDHYREKQEIVVTGHEDALALLEASQDGDKRDRAAA